MKKTKTLSQKDKNQSKATKMAAEATNLTRSNQIGPRVGKQDKKARKALVKTSIGAKSPTLQSVGTTKKVLHEAVLNWARGLESPFNGSPQKCPFNFNPTPSYLSFVATTVSARFGADGVAANNADQLTFFPGHLALAAANAVDVGGTVQSTVFDMDEVAYHHAFLKCGGDSAPNAVGPVSFVDITATGRNATAYVKSSGVGLNNAVNSLSGGGSAAIGWNTPLPITGDVRVEGHLRYKLLSMGIKIINTTPELNRGGNFVSFQPVTSCDILNPQSANAIHPSFKDWGPEGCTISWIPRLRDLSYWHPTSSGVLTSGVVTAPLSSSSATGAGVVVFINNPTGQPQTYDTEIICHWEISGYSVQSLAGTGKSTYLSDSVIKGALSAQINNEATASGFTQTLRASAGELGSAVKGAVGEAIKMAPRMAAASLK